jgi:hypothetical protein
MQLAAPPEMIVRWIVVSISVSVIVVLSRDRGEFPGSLQEQYPKCLPGPHHFCCGQRL